MPPIEVTVPMCPRPRLRGVDGAPRHRVDGVVVGLRGHRLGRTDLDDAGHADEHVDGREGALDVLHEGVDGLAVAHVADAGVHLAAPARQPSGGGVEIRLPACRDDDVVAAVEQLAGDEQAESA